MLGCNNTEAAERSEPMSKVRGGGQEVLPHVQGAVAVIAQERPRGTTLRPRSGAAAALCWSSREEILHTQGKRNPSKTVGAERGHQKADRLKPQTTSQSDHTDHSLV